MNKITFIRRMREMGFTDLYIGEVLDLYRQDQENGAGRGYEDYIPQSPQSKKDGAES